MAPENYNSIYTQNMLIVNANLWHILTLSVMNWSILNIILVIKGENENVYKASYKVSYKPDHSGEAHITAENPIISCIEHIVSCMPSDIRGHAVV
jgi:hypothetical protein